MDIAILGAGVAGVSAAILLKQKGFNVRVFERHRSATDIGAGIVVWPNAAFVLAQLGVLDQIRSCSGIPSRMQRFTNLGEDLGAISIDAISRHMGYPTFSILRHDFQQILIDKLASLGVEIQYGQEVAHIESGSSPDANDSTSSMATTVIFQDGTRVNADMVIGADGRMTSPTRRFVLGDNTPVYQGFINWIGVFEAEDNVFEEIAVTDYWGVGERFGIVPITKTKAYWAGGAASAQIGPNYPTDYKHELCSVFTDWPDPVKQVIDGTPVERINKIYVHDQNPSRTWHRSNVIIIGDAAHAPLPTSGQGASQALEDAWHLSNCLAGKKTGLQQAFEKFTALRFEKTANIIMAARGFASSLFNQDEAFCRRRNDNSKKTDFDAMAAAMAKGWRQHLPLEH